jgi:hypothetical protein
MTKIILPNGLSEENVLSQVISEYQASYDWVNAKRDLFRSREDLYMNNNDQENKVYVRLVFSTEQTLKALYSQNEIWVEFVGRRIGTESAALNRQNLAKFDFEEMDLWAKKDQVHDDKFHYGVGIEITDWRDPVRKCPKVIVVDPRCWIPDIYADVNRGFAYHGFELAMTKYDFDPKAWYFNIDSARTDAEQKLQDLIELEMEKWMSAEQARNYIEQDSSRWLWNKTDIEWDNAVYSVYRHMTTLNGRKYIVELANNMSLLIRCQEIKPVREEEKKDPSLVQFPVVVRNWIEKRWDPFGVSVPDILEDKQRMMQLFLNLNRIKAEHEAWWDIFFYDPNVVKNIDSLKIPSTNWPKYVKADLRNGTPMMEAPRSAIKQDALNMPSILQNQGSIDIWMDARTMWSSPDSSMSATENVRVQNNANLRLLLGMKVNNRAEKKFRDLLRLRPYQQYFKRNDKKNIYINSWVGITPQIIQQKDFDSSNDIDIKIISKSEAQEDSNTKLVKALPLMNFVLSRPWSKYGKDAMLRDVFVWSGLEKERVNVYVDPSPEELQAKEDLELINRNESPKPCENPQEDHWTYVVIYQSALNTDAKWKAIEDRMKLYMLSGQAEQATKQMQTLWQSDNLSNTQAQVTSNAMNMQWNTSKNASSLQDITQ